MRPGLSKGFWELCLTYLPLAFDIQQASCGKEQSQLSAVLPAPVLILCLPCLLTLPPHPCLITPASLPLPPLPPQPPASPASSPLPPLPPQLSVPHTGDLCILFFLPSSQEACFKSMPRSRGAQGPALMTPVTFPVLAKKLRLILNSSVSPLPLLLIQHL